MCTPVYVTDSVVKVKYEGKDYVCKITDYSEEQNEYFVQFMKKRKNGTYMVPRAKYEAWISHEDIVGLHSSL